MTPFTGNLGLGDWLLSQLGAELFKTHWLAPDPSLLRSSQGHTAVSQPEVRWIRQRGRGGGPVLGGRSGKREGSAGILEASSNAGMLTLMLWGAWEMQFLEPRVGARAHPC